MNWLDSHCHINDAAFKDDLDDVLSRMGEADVRKAMMISSYIEDYRYGLTIRHPSITFKHSLGIYPGDVDKVDEALFDSYAKLLRQGQQAEAERDLRAPARSGGAIEQAGHHPQPGCDTGHLRSLGKTSCKGRHALLFRFGGDGQALYEARLLHLDRRTNHLEKRQAGT